MVSRYVTKADKSTYQLLENTKTIFRIGFNRKEVTQMQGNAKYG